MRKYISKEEIKELPRRYFEGEIHIIEYEAQIYPAVKYLRQFDAIGFDTESRPSFRKGQKNGIALLQVATTDKAFLFRLNKIPLTDAIVALLSDETVKKIGLALKDDLRALRKLRSFEPAGFIDLQSHVQKYGIEDFSLRKLGAIVLNVRISKRQQLSNWESNTLKEGQIRYAATDAWAPLKIYQKLKQLDGHKLS